MGSSDREWEATRAAPHGADTAWSVVRRMVAAGDARAAMRMRNVADARRMSRRRLPRVVFDYVEGGADDELTMRRNESAFAASAFRPRMASGGFEPVLESSVLGVMLDLPVLLAPCGLVRLLHPDGAAGVARAAAARGTVSVLSTVAGSTMEEVASRARVPMWYQLYAAGGRRTADDLCERAATAGIEVMMVTVDTPTLGNRERDVRNGVAPPLRIDSHNAIPLGAQVLRRPRWAARLAVTGVRVGHRDRKLPAGKAMLQAAASPFTWDDLEHIRRRWAGRLVVKGLLSGEDARRAVSIGADAVVVSNHGGRQLDGVPATIEALPEVVQAVGEHIEVLVDGGVRRGAHVVLALALGARAVLVGRPFLYGLAAAGERGVEKILDIFAEEMRRTMILLGCRSVADLSPDWLYTRGSGSAAEGRFV